jgi:hypothetical protein
MQLEVLLDSDNLDPKRLRPLVQVAALADHSHDELIWELAHDAVARCTAPPPPVVASSFEQILRVRGASDFANSYQHREYLDDVFTPELGSVFVGVPRFFEAYFAQVPDLGDASEAFFKDCSGGVSDQPAPFDNDWRGWPENSKQDEMLSWLAGFIERLAAFAEGYKDKSAPMLH